MSNATIAIEATTPSTTTVTQSSLTETYDLRIFPTNVPVVAFTKGGPEPALPVTNFAQNGTLSNQPAAQTVRITTTVFADQTSSKAQAYNGNTFSNTAPGTEIPARCAALGPGGMATWTSTASVASATSTVTLTDTALVIPVQADNTQPIYVPEPSTSPYKDDTPTTKTMTSPVTSSSDDVVDVQTETPIGSIQPYTAVTAYDSIHIPHGHPPLITGGQDHKNWNKSTNSTDSNTQQVPGIAPIPSCLIITTTASRVFIGYPPSLSGYNNGTNANTSTSIYESSTTTELVTPSATTHVEIPPPPTVPFDSCKPEIWGRPGCLSTPASLSDTPPTPVGHQVGDVTAMSASSIISTTYETPALSVPTNSTTQPAQAQCISTFYSLPMDACTSTIYASKETVTVNCYGCIGHHALPSAAPYGSNVSHTLHVHETDTNAPPSPAKPPEP